VEDQSVMQRYLGVLRRRKWLVALAVVVTPAAALVFSLHQGQLYSASAEVYLSHQDVAAVLTNTTDPQINQLPDRYAQTQAELAREPAVAARALADSGDAFRDAGLAPWGASQFLASSSATPKQNADLLELSVTSSVPKVAERLAYAYAYAYAGYRRELDTASYRRALSQLDERLSKLEHANQKGTPLYNSLRAKEEQIRTLEALETPSQVVRTPDGAVQVQPRPVRNAILGLALGCLLAVAILAAAEALDTRVSSEEEIAARLGLNLLARIPRPPRKLRARQQLVTVAAPESPDADAFVLFRSNLELANLEHRARAVMITSAGPWEGKSTTAANLAVALAWSGKRVILADLDLRRPVIHAFFGLDERTGVTTVALGDEILDDALTVVTISERPADGASPPLNGHQRLIGRERELDGNGHRAGANGMVAIEVLPTGQLPPGPGDFLSTPRFDRILAELRVRADYVIIDAPPLLEGSGAPILSSKVDGIVVISHLETARRSMLRELRRLLDTSTATTLGFVLTGARRVDGYGYGSTARGRAPRARSSSVSRSRRADLGGSSSGVERA
jgi:polysaccharide biosynthesis transport protein